MTHIAADPTELRRLSEHLRDAALEHAGTAQTLSNPALPSMPYSVHAIVAEGLLNVAARLREVARGELDEAQDLAVCAYWFEKAGEPEGLLGDLGLWDTQLELALADVGTMSDAAPMSRLSIEDWLGSDILDASPDAVATVFAGLSPGQRAFLIAAYPQQIGSLDGAPFQDRFAANAMVIDQQVALFEREVDEARAALADDPHNDLLQAQVQVLQERLDLLRGFDDPDRRFLLFDPSGDGRIAEVIGGNLNDADHIAVVVPGMNNDLMNFEGLSGNAQRLWQEADRRARGEVVTIAWLGYDTPEGASAAFGGAAEDGAENLDAFIDGLRAHRPDAHLTGVAHSYGGVVQGNALRDGLDLDDAAFVGVPGTGGGVHDVEELGDRAEIWAGKAPLFSSGEVEIVPLAPGHGEEPTSDGFGANRFETGEAAGHSSYFDAGTDSIINLGFIVVDRDSAVTAY